MSQTLDIFNKTLASASPETKQHVEKMFTFANMLDHTLEEHGVKQKGIVRQYIIDSNVFPIKTEEQFQAACARIEELLPLCWEDVPDDDPKNIELAVIANLVADWEDEHVNLSI